MKVLRLSVVRKRRSGITRTLSAAIDGAIDRISRWLWLVALAATATSKRCHFRMYIK